MTSVETLVDRLASIRSALHSVANAWRPGELPEAPPPYLVTGLGLSQVPARLLVAQLGEFGLAAEYVPPSEFVTHSSSKHSGTLVLFSQELSPNARFVLWHQPNFQRMIVFTSLVPDATAPTDDARRMLADAVARNACCVTLPPREECGFLLRVVGPAVAALAGMRWAHELRGQSITHEWLSSIADQYAYPSPNIDHCDTLVQNGAIDPVALIASGRYGAACYGFKWKLLEALHIFEPPMWDILQVAHGPFQSLYEKSHTLIVLERSSRAHEQGLTQHLCEMVAPDRHRILTLRAKMPGLCSWFEHDAQLNALIVATLRQHPIDLTNWPGKGTDGALYGLTAEPEQFSGFASAG
jgi:hypothetical protein